MQATLDTFVIPLYPAGLSRMQATLDAFEFPTPAGTVQPHTESEK